MFPSSPWRPVYSDPRYTRALAAVAQGNTVGLIYRRDPSGACQCGDAACCRRAHWYPDVDGYPLGATQNLEVIATWLEHLGPESKTELGCTTRFGTVPIASYTAPPDTTTAPPTP